jgi:HK97 family phage portal protein
MANKISIQNFVNTGRTKDRNTKAFIEEGYKKNVIIFRCINEIARAISSVKIEVHNEEGPIDNHQALSILSKPNPQESWSQFISHAFSDFMISGNMFILGNSDSGRFTEMWVLSPLLVDVVGGNSGLPDRFIYAKGTQQERVLPVNQVTGFSQIFHMKTYNPEDNFIGLSPLHSVSLSADVHNNGLAWNAALLENGARPSGIVTFEKDMEPDAASIARVKTWLKSRFGFKNAGEPLVIHGAKFEKTADSATDMDFLNAMKEVSKYIASALGVPLPLVDNDASSFNNIEQAKERLWTDTVLPLLNDFLSSFGAWFLAQYGDDLKLAYDLDSIQALETLRSKRFEKAASMLRDGLGTRNEARRLLGYEEEQNSVSNEVMIPSGLIPAGSANSSGAIELEDESDSGDQPQTVATVDAAAPVSNIALNAEQTTALQQIVQAVADGQLPPQSATLIILISFPNIPQADIEKMVAAAANFTPAATDQALLKSFGLTEEEMKALK